MASADPAHTGTGPDQPSLGSGARPPHLILRSAGVAGMAFSLLFVASLYLVSFRPPDGIDEAGFVDWYEANALGPVTVAALYVAPFAGIAFLWFIGLVRARIGTREDQLFATVFLGSGLLFVGMYWAGAASSRASSRATASTLRRRSRPRPSRRSAHRPSRSCSCSLPGPRPSSCW